MIPNHRALAVLAALSLSVSTVGCLTETRPEAEETTSDLVSRSAYFETFQGQDGQHYFHLMAANGENVLRSEGYATLAGAQGGVASVLAHGASAANFAVLEAATGEFYFNLVASNGEVIGTSELYASKSNAERGARTVRGLVKLATASTVEAPRRERFELFVGEDGQTYFRLRAGNGEILLGSEGYSTKSGAKKGIAAATAATAANIETFATRDGGFALRIVANNGEIIARGETYASASNATRAKNRIAAILANPLPTAE